MVAEQSPEHIVQQEADHFSQAHDKVKAQVGAREFEDYGRYWRYPFHLVGTGDSSAREVLFTLEHYEKGEYPACLILSGSLLEGEREIWFGKWAELSLVVRKVLDTEEVDRVIEDL